MHTVISSLFVMSTEENLNMDWVINPQAQAVEVSNPRVGSVCGEFKCGRVECRLVSFACKYEQDLCSQCLNRHPSLDILMLQDTHLAPQSSRIKELSRYPNLDFASYCPNGTRGVATIISKKRVKFLTKLDVADSHGNLLTSVVEFQSHVIYVAKCYLRST